MRHNLVQLEYLRGSLRRSGDGWGPIRRWSWRRGGSGAVAAIRIFKCARTNMCQLSSFTTVKMPPSGDTGVLLPIARECEDSFL
jgi:hypothetical protein